jgi:hypothetical protein
MAYKLSVSTDYYDLLTHKLEHFALPDDLKEWCFSNTLCVKIVAELDEQFNNLFRTFKLNNKIKPSERKEISCFETREIHKLLREQYQIEENHLNFLYDYEDINEFLDARHAICHTSAGRNITIDRCLKIIPLFESLLDAVKDCITLRTDIKSMKNKFNK